MNTASMNLGRLLGLHLAALMARSWPQWVRGYECGNLTERDRRERLLREAEGISETTEDQDSPRNQVMISPPTTPPNISNRKTVMDPSHFPKTQASDTRIKKTKAFKRPAPRRPVTRSMVSEEVAFDSRKNHVKIRRLSQFPVMSFEQYLRSQVSHRAFLS